MTFGEKLQLLRKSKNMSQEQLAALIPVSRQVVSKWELGESLPDMDNVIQLSNLFEVPIDYLLKDEFQDYDNIPTIREGNILLKNNYHSKIIWPILLISIVIGFISLFISGYKNSIQIFILPAYIVLTAVLSSSIKTKSYGIIAGYDKNINYNKKALNKILYNIAFLSALDLMIYQILNLVLVLIKGPGIVYKILLYGIIISFFLNIFVINFKYREELIPSKEERERLKRESKPQNIFLIKFLFTILVFLFMFEISNTKNNTVEALKFIGLLSPNIILFLIMTLRREYDKSEYLFKSDKIMILLSFVLDILTIGYGLGIG